MDASFLRLIDSLHAEQAADCDRSAH
jgi:hypothetical protein